MVQGGSIGFFEHEAYTSNYFMRYFVRDQFKQPDSTALGHQFYLYTKHLQLIEAFIDSHRKGLELDFTAFQELFYLQRLQAASTQKE